MAVIYNRGVKRLALAAFQCSLQDDSKITKEFWQYCNGSLSKKRLKSRSQATFARYKFLSFGNNCTDAGKVIIFFFLFLEIDLTSGYIAEIVAQRSGDLHIQNFMRPLARLLIYSIWPPEAHKFDTSDLQSFIKVKN